MVRRTEKEQPAKRESLLKEDEKYFFWATKRNV